MASPLTRWAVLVLAAAGLHLAGIYDWGRGFERGLALLGLAALVVAAHRLSPGKSASELDRRVLLLLALVLAAWQLRSLVASLPVPHPNDVGESTVLAARAFWREGLNPYETRVDAVEIAHPRFPFDGYKYFPLTLLAYSPLVLALGTRGLYVTNLLLQAAAALAVYRIGALLGPRVGTKPAPYALVLYLVSPWIHFELYRQGVNDVLPLALLLWSAERLLHGHERASAALAGAALGAKWLPAPIFVAVALPQVRNRPGYLTVCAAVTAALVLPFAAWDPVAFVGNTFVYFALKPGDSTGFLHGIAPGLRVATLAALGAAAVALYVRHLRGSRGRPETVVFVTALLGTLAMLPLKENHRNHLIWIVPWIALAAFQDRNGDGNPFRRPKTVAVPIS